MNKAMIIALVALVAVSTACSGDSSSGDDDSTGSGSGISAGFVPEQPSPGSDTVSADEGDIGGNLVIVEIKVTDTGGISGASFDLTYDPSMARYDDYWTEGNLFQSGVYQVGEPENGHLFVGVVREPGPPLGDASGTQKSIRGLRIEVIQAGQSIMSFPFEGPELTDDQPLPLPIPDINWSGGLLTGD